MKILIIADVHQDTDYVKKSFAACASFDQCVFLGDFFDSLKTPPEVSGFQETCEYLKHLVLNHPQKEKFKFCVGNHDMKYIYENKCRGSVPAVITPHYYCSGVTGSKIKRFRKEFFDKRLGDQFFIDNFRLAHRIDGWTFSHGGVIMQHLPYGHTIDSFVDDICVDAWKNFRMFNHPHNYLISDVGLCRFGNANIGGLLWCDWRSEFVACSDVGKQVVGHTTVVGRPGIIDKGGPSESWNIDMSQGCFGIINNGDFEYHYV